MIRYDLTCNAGHAFDAWFPGSESYDEQAASGLVACPRCGSTDVRKAIMAPSVPRASVPDGPDLSGGIPASFRRSLREMRERILAGSENVGLAFADEARRMHRGEAPVRAVHGEASPDEARSLIEEGIPVAPIPPEPGGH